jgi:flagellar biosynthesis/type III secretory pathway protein FliH
LLIAAIYEFASLGKGEDFVMRVQAKVRHRNPFVEMIEQVRKEGREEALEEGREEGRLSELRSTLRDQLARKYPQIKATTITKRLKACDEATLRSLVLRVLDDLNWKQFWA